MDAVAAAGNEPTSSRRSPRDPAHRAQSEVPCLSNSLSFTEADVTFQPMNRWLEDCEDHVHSVVTFLIYMAIVTAPQSNSSTFRCF
ncbi:uncharacterized protein [Heterodontus francisci]|uniref:uncharacterized protein isoform X2 n=1 Tax=Heterodontus francisci TaxID=7792 RepID=UPI00355B6436